MSTRSAPAGPPGAAQAAPGAARPPASDLADRPLVIAWEVTRACGYRCHHCRADAQPRPLPGELDAAQGRALVDALSPFAGSVLVLTGGDPLLRKDLEALVERAAGVGLAVALTPSATPRVRTERLRSLRDAGVRQVALSLDGAGPPSHDGLRGLRGSFARTLRILEAAREEGLRVQVNTTVTRRNQDELEDVAHLAEGVGAEMWSVFFLVPVGRAQSREMISAEDHERAFHRLADLAGRVPFRLKVTAAPAYRRVLVERGVPRAALPPAANDGRGFMFVSHDGEVCPSGFLPISAGNVRTSSPVDLYRGSRLFRELRDPALLRGRCGRCPFRDTCGGSRARAFAVSGDHLGEDPACVFEPEGTTC